MPIYEFKCEKGHKFDRFLSLKDYKKPQVCDCGAKSEKLISIPMINCDMANWDRYISPVSGREITSYRERRKDMEDHNCVDYEPSLKNHATNHMKTEDSKLEKKMDDYVEKSIQEMPARKREKLAKELSSGADCAYTRS